MVNIEFKKEEIEKIFLEAQNALFREENIVKIKYNNFESTTFDLNNSELLSDISGKPIVYCIWMGTSEKDLSPKYIGHAGSNVSRQRIRAHFAKKNEGTWSQLAKVKEVISNGGCVGITIITIEPPYMRKALEDWLIEENSNLLEWNEIGRKKVKTIVKSNSL